MADWDGAGRDVAASLVHRLTGQRCPNFRQRSALPTNMEMIGVWRVGWSAYWRSAYWRERWICQVPKVVQGSARVLERLALQGTGKLAR